MRLGEALAVQWGDIDFEGRFIEVRRNLVSGRIETPKSGKSRRVDMSLQLAATLKEHLVEGKKRL
jgi:integrase